MSSPRRLDRATFLARFGDLFEHSPWIAAAAFDAGLDAAADTVEGLHAALVAAMRRAPRERLLELVLAHPDLAGRLALAGEVTADSSAEQASAGLDRLSPDELARFRSLNEAYTRRFGFPFIMAIKGKTKADILAAFETRLAHDAATEFATALSEIEGIVLLRLRERMSLS
jgi:OHCU decarboxylase